MEYSEDAIKEAKRVGEKIHNAIVDEFLTQFETDRSAGKYKSAEEVSERERNAALATGRRPNEMVPGGIMALRTELFDDVKIRAEEAWDRAYDASLAASVPDRLARAEIAAVEALEGLVDDTAKVIEAVAGGAKVAVKVANVIDGEIENIAIGMAKVAAKGLREVAADLRGVEADIANAATKSLKPALQGSNLEVVALLARMYERYRAGDESDIAFIDGLVDIKPADLACAPSDVIDRYHSIMRRHPPGLTPKPLPSFPPNGVELSPRPKNQVIDGIKAGDGERMPVNAREQTFVSARPPVRQRIGTPPKDVYVWMDEKNKRELFHLDNKRGQFVITDTNDKTYASTVLAMLREAENFYGDKGFQLTGSPEFIEFARNLAEEHGVTIKDEEYFKRQLPVAA